VYQSVSVCVVAFRNQVPTFAATTAAIDALNRSRISGARFGEVISNNHSRQRREEATLYRILTVVREAAPGAPERADAPGEAKKIGRERLFCICT
jgi:hypothetical protein